MYSLSLAPQARNIDARAPLKPNAGARPSRSCSAVAVAAGM
jgi:hypothetical protein